MRHSPDKMPDPQTRLLGEGLRELFGELGEETLAALTPMLEWVEVAGGEVVLRQGAADRDVYFVICGRLRAYREEGGVRRQLSEIARGEAIGEMAFFTGAPRYATVVAMRDSVLVRISHPSLERLLTQFPNVTLNMTRLVIARFSAGGGAPKARPRPTNLCLFPVTTGVDLDAVGRRLAASLGADKAILLTSQALEARLGMPGVAQADKTRGDAYRQLTRALDELELRFATVVYVPDADLRAEWSQRCLRMADRVLLLADARQSPEVREVEADFLNGDRRITAAEQVLVLLHGPETLVPRATANWLDRRAASVTGHAHVRPHKDADLSRLARLQGARATGLVLAGGGARCFAHLGVYKALQESGVQIDFVGGSGLGAVMGALIALDAPAEELIAYAREAFTGNPTGDVNIVPLASLIRGRKLKAVLDGAIEHLAGADARIEDTWKSFFCVAANYSKAQESVLRRGNLARAIRASAAVPGLLPPVPVDGDLMMEGGAFNNYPTDVMAASGAARIIGVRIARDVTGEFAFDEVPGSGALAWDKLTGSRRKYRVPSLMAILMNATKLYSASREDAASARTHLEFRINLPSVGILDWHAFDHAVDVGYRNAQKVLAGMPADDLAAWRGG